MVSNFSEFINEMSIAKRGDWSEGTNFVGDFSIEKLDKYVKIPILMDDFELYQLRNSLTFIVGIPGEIVIQTKSGEETKHIFTVVFNIQLVREKLLDKLGYNKMIRVKGVSTHIDYQRSGIATTIYKYLVNVLGYTIIGDKEQYFGARRLWARLSKLLDVQVDLVDISSKSVLEYNITLHHGKYDEDYDNRLWSFEEDISKEYIRSVLTSIA